MQARRREEGEGDERESKDTRETPGEKRRQTVIILSNDTAYRYNFQTRTIISVEGLLLILFFFFLHLYIFIGKERGKRKEGERWEEEGKSEHDDEAGRARRKKEVVVTSLRVRE